MVAAKDPRRPAREAEMVESPRAADPDPERLAEDAARASEIAATQVAIFDALPAHVALVDSQGVIVAVNAAWRNFGVANSLAGDRFCVGQNYIDICDRARGERSEEAGAVAAGLRAVLTRTLPQLSLEYPCHSTAEQRWFRLVVTPLGAERAGGAVVMHIDITERKLAELALRESEQRYRQLFEVNPQPMWVYDLETLRFLAVNDAAIVKYGYSREEFLALTILDIRPSEDAAEVRQVASDSSTSIRIESNWRHRLKDGTIIRVEISSHSISFAGRAARLVLASDVTRREASVERLRSSEREMKALAGELENQRARLVAAQAVAKVGSWETDLASFEVTWSDETYRIFGLERQDFRPTHAAFLELVHPSDRLAVDRAFRGSLETRDVRSIDHRLVRPDGTERVVEERWRTLVDSAGRPVRAVGTCQDITERRAAERELRRSQALLRTASRVSRLGAWAADLPDLRLDWSEEVRILHEVGPEFAPTVEQALEFYAPEYRDAIRSHFLACLEDGTAFDLEAPIVTARGRRVWARVIGEAVRDVDGRIARVQGAFQDIDEQRRIQDQLRIGEERFRLVSKATNDAIWDWDLATGELWWNEGFETLFGYRRDEVESTTESWNRHVHPDDYERVSAEIHAAIDGRSENWSGEYRFRRHDGSYAWVLDRGYVIRDREGKALRMIGGMTDLTERRRAEERLAEQAALLDAAHEAILVKDFEDRILYWNKGAERTYGWTAEEAVGRTSADLLYVDPSPIPAAVAAVLAEGRWQGVLRHRTKDGRERDIEASCTLLRDERGEPKAILSFNVDITERRQLEAQLLRAQRMESIGTMAGGIAHDLNNVLAPILMAIELLREDEKDANRLELLATMESSALRGADMVRQVLFFARGVEGQPMLLDPAAIVRDVQRILKDALPKNIALEVSMAEELWKVRADATQLQQVLMNLCVNARDAMPEGGRLTLALENAVVDETYAAMNPQSKPGAYVMLKVADTGVGIPAEIQERVFEPFFTTKEVGSGTGLGLSTVHTIVRGHGGFVNLYSEPGRGSKFRIYLPADASGSEIENAVIEASPLPRGSGEWVLVVDDEESIRKVTKRTLERFGYRVLVAANGAEAISIFAQKRGEIAVVLTDMAMPVMDGPATIRALKAIEPGVRIIGSSGLAAEGLLAEATGAGVHRFVPKPYTADALLRALREALTETA